VEQVANGVSTRMAVLYLLLGGSEPALSTGRAAPETAPEQAPAARTEESN
jgi:aspartate carbamoyltransferase catalytic subunit